MFLLCARALHVPARTLPLFVRLSACLSWQITGACERVRCACTGPRARMPCIYLRLPFLCLGVCFVLHLVDVLNCSEFQTLGLENIYIYVYMFPNPRAGKLIAIEHVDQVQDKAHAQAQERQAQVNAGHARTKGPRKHNARSRRHRLSAKTNRLTNAQTTVRYAQARAKHAHTKETCSAGTRAMTVHLSLSLCLVMTAANAQGS